MSILSKEALCLVILFVILRAEKAFEEYPLEKKHEFLDAQKKNLDFWIRSTFIELIGGSPGNTPLTGEQIVQKRGRIKIWRELLEKNLNEQEKLSEEIDLIKKKYLTF